MYKISDDYKNLIEQNTSLSSKNKIVVDGVEYTGKILKTSPKLKHQNTSLFGGFPIKTCNFEIYDFKNELDFENKEIYVYKGLVINGKIEYIPQGIFIPTADKISTNISQRSISFKDIQDRSQYFDSQYVTDLDWSNRTHTGLEIVQEICDKVGVPLGTLEFNWSTYSFNQPNFPSNITNREVISRLAEIGGSIAFINRDGELVIESPFSTGHKIKRKRYEKCTQEKLIGPFNTVTLGMEGLDNDIVYPDVVTDERIEYKILDNPFVSLNPTEMIENVAQYIIGKSYVPFSLTNFVDGFYLDLNDEIEITNKNGETFTGLILNYETTSRIKSNIKAEIYDKGKTNYNLAGSVKQSVADVRFQVDHVNKQVQSTIEEVKGQEQKLSQVTQTVDEIQSQISNIANLTVEGETTNAELNVVKLYGGSPLSIKIHPIGEYVDLTYPTHTIYSSDNTYTRIKSYFKIEKVDGGFSYTYDMPELLYLDENNYDEFEFDYGNKKCFKTKRLDFDDSGNLIILSNPKIEDLPYIDIDLPEGDYKFSLLDGYTHAYIYGKFASQNDYTDLFATKIELKSSITQTEDKIESEVSNVTSLLNKEVEKLDSKITQTATDITTEVSNYKETIDGEVEDLSSKITQTATDVTSQITETKTDLEGQIESVSSTLTQTKNSLTSEINQKVGNNEIISRINQSAEAIQINANKISLEGKNIALTSDNISISSRNFNVDKYGNLTCNNANLSGTFEQKDDDGNTAIKIEQKSIEFYDWYGNNAKTGGLFCNSTTSDKGIYLYSYENRLISICNRTDSTNFKPIANFNPNGVEIWGNLEVIGEKDRLVEINDNEYALLNAYETATPYFGDIGSTRTDENGYCKIYLEEIFSKTIEKDTYKVFIQKCGEGNLYVKKYPDYFEVIGTPNLEFDWEIKAIQKGYKNVRLKIKEKKSEK